MNEQDTAHPNQASAARKHLEGVEILLFLRVLVLLRRVLAMPAHTPLLAAHLLLDAQILLAETAGAQASE